jgi:hypothetical protein
LIEKMLHKLYVFYGAALR